jgi:hypothetical protein
MSKFTAEQKKEYAAAKQEEQRTMLADAVQRLCTSEGWLRYLEATAKFPGRSFNNRMLIAFQDPEATLVEGGKTWPKKWDRKVQPEGYEHPIMILAPIMGDVKDKDGNVIKGLDGKPKQRVIFYKSVKIYDVRWTEGKPIPARPEPQPVTGDSHEEYILRASQYIEGMGANVTDTAVEYFTEDEALTFPISANAVNGQVRELVRAAARIGAVTPMAEAELSLSAAQQEVIIESAAYMVCQNIALDTTGMTVPYIASWDEDPKKAQSIMRDFAAIIDEVATAVTEAIS